MVWHDAQRSVEAIWFTEGPVALTPLWQLAHWDGLIPAWLKPGPVGDGAATGTGAAGGALGVAEPKGLHAAVVWQPPQSSVVATWVGDLPVATVPLWQVPQRAPAGMGIWAEGAFPTGGAVGPGVGTGAVGTAGSHSWVLWQSSQVSGEGM